MPTRSPALERLEPRDVPAHLYAVGTDPGVPAVARLIDADTGLDRVTVAPFGEGFTGGVRVAVSDVTGDRVPELEVAPGQGAATVTRVVDGISWKPVA